MSIHVLKQLYYTLIYPYLNYAAVVWGNTYPSNLNKLCSLQNEGIRCTFFAYERVIRPKFSINFLIFLNLITLLNWAHAYLHIRYLTSLPVFVHCFMILSEQSLTCTSITPDTPLRVIFINQT